MAIKLKGADLKAKFEEYGGFVLSGGYLFDSENKQQISACIDVFEKNERGLVIIGNPGSGKTLFFEMMQRIITPNTNISFARISVLDVVLKFNNKAIQHGVFIMWRDQNVFFDDLGTESIGYSFGEKVNVFEKFIQHRYDLFRAKGIKTHFTTNLSYEGLKERYGLRCVSRLGEMCDIVLMGEKKTSTDRRTLRNFIGLPHVIHDLPRQETGVDYERYKKNEAENPTENESSGQKLRKVLGTPTKL